MKKKGMPTALFLVAIGLLLFFIYALFNVGIDLNQTITTNQSTVATFASRCLQFVSDNKIILGAAAAVLVAIKLFIGAPGPARG